MADITPGIIIHSPVLVPEQGCAFPEDSEGHYQVCRFYKGLNRTRGRFIAPPEWNAPKCDLFNLWLDKPLTKCTVCRALCESEALLK